MSPYEKGDTSWKEDGELVFRLSRLRKQLRYRKRIDGFRKVMQMYPCRASYRTEGEDTALHSASCWGHVEMVNDLLLAGWDINATNSLNQTPLILASKEGYFAVVKLLLKGSSWGGKPKLKVKDTMGLTCIGWASKVAAREGLKQKGCQRIVQLLEEEWETRQKEKRRKKREERIAKKRRELMASGEDPDGAEDSEDDVSDEAGNSDEEVSDSDPESSIYEDFGEEDSAEEKEEL